MENLAICVHGHFYQPPRENPLTGEIPLEPGAAPYRNWNERIHDQCYRPNAVAGNFEKISFNLGPTLIEWMEHQDPDTLASIVEQNHRNVEMHGVGNAMAQSYNHTILPLANHRDKETQVLWGIADFKHHFGHAPQGMWLPETAADDETLLVLAECGIEFTILAPWQADTLNLDPTHPYRVPLPGGKEIAVFFYDQDLSTRISFDPGATLNADRFVLESLMPKYTLDKGRALEPQLIMIASDGELYGHHQPFREKFLAYLMDGAVNSYRVDISYPALWLKQHPLKHRVLIRENTSWSCYHGVMRWQGPCGCCANGEWKEHFRNALNRLAEAVDEQYCQWVERYQADPWQLRNDYIQVVLRTQSLESFLADHIQHPLTQEDRSRLGVLLRAQYERQRMFTSCGWFFDDYDRIEPRNNTAYAAQAIWLTQKATGLDLSPLAVESLHRVASNRTGLRADEVFRSQFNQAQQTWS